MKKTKQGMIIGGVVGLVYGIILWLAPSPSPQTVARILTIAGPILFFGGLALVGAFLGGLISLGAKE